MQKAHEHRLFAHQKVDAHPLAFYTHKHGRDEEHRVSGCPSIGVHQHDRHGEDEEMAINPG